MLQNGQLQDYQMGGRIGKGASGLVYRALNIRSGETLAIKKIDNLSAKEQVETMNEIDLLKQLRHENIVHLYGYEKTDTCLFIVMEYCELGSLLDSLKKFGNFPETLISGYIKQVLTGLQYLHQQGVIHRDIKAGNLLSTKQGVVKLADFGIASKINAKKRAVFEGSPYWMAPEVIELNGSSAASDIWSVGCTSIELYTGKPPYSNLEAVSALFRIVSDDSVEYPSTISPHFKDFLDECFQRDPNLRISAFRLYNHPWISKYSSSNRSFLKQHIGNELEIQSKTKPIDLNLFKDISETEDYTNDFESFQKLELVQNPEEAVNVPENLFDEANNPSYQLSNSIHLSQAKVWETIRTVQSCQYDKKVIMNALKTFTSYQFTGTDDLDLQIMSVFSIISVEFPKEIYFSEDFTNFLSNALIIMPQSTITLAGGLVIMLLNEGPISTKTRIITTIKQAIDERIGENKNQLKLFIVGTDIPLILINELNNRRQSFDIHSEALNGIIAGFLYDISHGSREISTKLGNPSIFKGLFVATQMQKSKIVSKILKTMKNICNFLERPSEIFDVENYVEILCGFLSKRVSDKSQKEDHQMPVLNILFYVLRHDRTRQERALNSGILSYLKHACFHSGPAKQFAIPILSDMVRHPCTKHLWKNNILDTLFALLNEDGCWRNILFESLLSWLSREPGKVEKEMLQSLCPILIRILKCEGSSGKGIVEHLVLLISISQPIGIKLMQHGLVEILLALAVQTTPETLLDILKIIGLVAKPDYAEYWNSNHQQHLQALHFTGSIKESKSILIGKLAERIEQSLKFIGSDL